MSFKHNLCELRNSQLIGQSSCRRSQINAIQPVSMEDISHKIKNSICFILEACDEQGLDKTTKYMAYTIFLRYVNSHTFGSDDHISLLILCCLRLATKFNEAQGKSNIFDQAAYSKLLTPHINSSDILQFQIQLFCELNFKLYIKSPYQYLNQLINERNIPISFYQTINAYIDFALTLSQLSLYTSQQIFSGCLYALKNTRNIENKKILGLIQEVCATIYNSQQVGNIIITVWQQIMQEQQQY